MFISGRLLNSYQSKGTECLQNFYEFFGGPVFFVGVQI